MMQLLMIEPQNIRLVKQIDPRRGVTWMCRMQPTPGDVRLKDVVASGFGASRPSAYVALFRVLAMQGWAVVVVKR